MVFLNDTSWSDRFVQYSEILGDMDSYLDELPEYMDRWDVIGRYKKRRKKHLAGQESILQPLQLLYEAGWVEGTPALNHPGDEGPESVNMVYPNPIRIWSIPIR